MSSAVICTFPKEKQSDVIKICSITYKVYNDSSTQCGLETLRQPLHKKQSAESISDTVTIGLPFAHRHGIHCFIIMASNGTYTALVQGAFSLGTILL